MKLLSRSLAALLAAVPMTATPAFAALGGDASSIESDRAVLKGELHAGLMSGYEVREIKTSYGAVVREYLKPDGQVFAVSWHGPTIPDLSKLLGPYYARYAQGLREPHSAGHRHLRIEQPGLIVESNGRMRAFYGRAWDPALLPENFTADDIR